MNSRRGLIPTPITDKNGKITTVHKKPQPSPATIPAMPSPVLAKKRDLDEVRRSIAERVAAQGGPLGTNSYILNDLQQFSETALLNVEAALQNDDDIAQGVADQISNGWSGATINETLYFHQKSESSDYWHTIAEVSALTHYAVVNTHEDLSTADETVQQQCIALMKFPRLIDTLPQEPSPFLDYVDDLNVDARVINDESLVTLIANRPDGVERIAEIVLQHRTSNAAAINGIMEGALPAMAEGHL